MNRIVVFGGTGMLGKALEKIRPDLICFGSEFDISKYENIEEILNSINPDIIINAAALKSEHVDSNKERSIEVNIVGSANVSAYCIKYHKKLVYISTDYVYPGKTGDYKENDDVNPKNLYAWTKLAGEVPVRMVDNHQIIRTSFGSSKFPYKKAYGNLYVSKDYVDIIAEMILKVIEKGYIGVINVGTERKSLYDYAVKRNDDVEVGFLEEEQDFSLNTDLYKMLLSR